MRAKKIHAEIVENKILSRFSSIQRCILMRFFFRSTPIDGSFIRTNPRCFFLNIKIRDKNVNLYAGNKVSLIIQLEYKHSPKSHSVNGMAFEYYSVRK